MSEDKEILQVLDSARKIAISMTCAAALWLTNCGGPPPTPEELWQAALPDRPSTYGLTLPEPVHVPAYVADSSINPKAVERLVPLMLQIDAQGKVTDVWAEAAEDFLFAAFYEDYLRSIVFEPGFRDSTRVAMRLPITMQVGDRGSVPVLLFPVYENRTIEEYDLYSRALARNGLELPTIEYFPSYNCDIDSFSTAPIYPFILYSLDLDSTGYPTAIEPLRSTYSKYEHQLRMAVNWGRYTPLKVGGMPQASRCYVLISFFPLSEYPSVPLDFARLDSLPLLERLRVRIFPDTLGLMAGPVPASFWQDRVRTEREWLPNYELFSTRVAIDSLGQAAHLGSTGTRKWHGLLVQNLVREIRFYPALDFHGRPHAYQGMLYLERLPKRPVRIWITWLPESRLETNF